MSEEEYSLEQLNFFRLCHVTTTIITEGLREVFKREWNALYGISHGNWNDNAKNGIDFYSLSSAKEKKMKEMLIIRNGNTLEWDCTCLSFAINCLVKKGLDPKVKKAANDLRTFRNEHFAHVFHDKVPETRFQALIQDVIEAFKDLTLDYSVIEDIKSQSSFSTAELQDIREQLKKERQRNEEPQTFCDLPPKPSHESIQRQNEVNSIIQAMEQLQSLYPNEVTHFYLSGNPGCGKSETARQVGEKVFNNIANETTKTFVATLNASSVDSLLKSFADFARQLKHNEDTIQSIALSNTLTPEDKISNLFGLVKAKIDMFSSWLMIVDNVVDLKKISTFFLSIGKEGKGQVLVTTQDSHAIPFSTTMVHHVSLSKGMSDEDAVCALCSISGKERYQDVTLEVAKALDLQPLALACAGFYMKLINTHRPFSWNECLSKLQKESLQHLQKPYLDSSGQNYPHSMTAAIKLAIDRVIEKDETMMSVFQFLSVLAQEPISLEYVVQYVTKCIPNADKDLVAARIVRSSLVLTSEDFQSIRLHQVVLKL